MRCFFQILVTLSLLACAYTSPIIQKVTSIQSGKQATIGVAVADDVHYWENNKKQYPLLSVFKLHVAVAVLDKVNKGELSLKQKINVADNELDLKTYSPMLKKYPAIGFKISVKELLYYMLAESDNNACDILIARAGGIKNIQDYIRKIGLHKTNIRVTEAQMQQDSKLQYQNTTSLSDMITLLEMINNNKLFSCRLHQELLDIMSSTKTGKDKIKKYIPQTVTVAHKTGSSSRINNKKIADNDVAIIKANGKTYYLAIFVTDSYETDVENAEIIATLSDEIYKMNVNK